MTEHPHNPKTGLLDEDAFESSLHGAAGEGTQPLSATGFDGAYDKAVPVEAEIVGQPQPPPWVGRRLGNFKLLRLLGKGAMGLVIQAQDVNLGRLVALKVLRKQIRGMDDERKVQQFLREAKAVARIEHPNVARIHQIDQHEGWWYIASEFIEGGSVRDVVRAAGPLTPARACPILADAADALLAVHQVGMVHRDVKPSNIMLTRTGRAKLVDFGLVRMDDPEDPFDFSDQTIGTPHYIAPELIAHRPSTPASDVYSLGATLYFTLTGRPPFESDDMQEILRRHVQQPRPDARVACPACSESLALLIARMMAVDPAQRPAMTEVLGALRAENLGSPHGDSSIIIDPGSLAVLARSEIDRSSLVLVGTSVRRKKPGAWRLWGVILGGAALVVAAGYLVLTADHPRRGGLPVAGREGFAARFPAAPLSYGQRAPGDRPAPRSISLPFSYLAQHGPGEFRFAAHRDGRRCFPIDSPQAAMIPEPGFVGYRTITEAEADGKRFPVDPAP